MSIEMLTEITFLLQNNNNNKKTFSSYSAFSSKAFKVKQRNIAWDVSVDLRAHIVGNVTFVQHHFYQLLVAMMAPLDYSTPFTIKETTVVAYIEVHRFLSSLFLC